MIDLNKTKVSPVLQSATFPQAPTPPEQLATIVQLLRQQKADFTAIVRSIEKPTMCDHRPGRKDDCGRDVHGRGCKLANGKMVSVTVPMF